MNAITNLQCQKRCVLDQNTNSQFGHPNNDWYIVHKSLKSKTPITRQCMLDSKPYLQLLTPLSTNPSFRRYAYTHPRRFTHGNWDVPHHMFHDFLKYVVMALV